MSDDLDRIAPRKVKKMYLDSRRAEGVRDATLEAHYYRLKVFVDWLEDNDVEALSEVKGRTIHDYKVHRREVDEIAVVSLQGQVSTIRQFLRFGASIDAAKENLADKIQLPTPENDTRDTRIEIDHAERILDWLDRFQYASRDHALFALTWHTACRIGGIRALDLRDLKFDADQPHLQFRHRRKTDTPLKNGRDGERDVAIADWLVDILQDYIDHNRVSTTDDYGRSPLFTTREGRLSEGWVRTSFYVMSHPCNVGDCPHGTTEEECEIKNDTKNYASKCPSARPPHDVRRGSISMHLRSGWPMDPLAERVNATPKVIRKHYDVRSAREAMLTRSEFLQEFHA